MYRSHMKLAKSTGHIPGGDGHLEAIAQEPEGSTADLARDPSAGCAPRNARRGTPPGVGIARSRRRGSERTGRGVGVRDRTKAVIVADAGAMLARIDADVQVSARAITSQPRIHRRCLARAAP
jgi:hypothetical protein